MKKKSILLYSILAVLLILVIYFSVKIYKFYSIKSDIQYIKTLDNSESRLIGVVDNKYYRIKDNKFEAFDRNNKEIFSFKANNIVDIIYDRVIYLFTGDGKVFSISRYNGKEEKIIDLKMEIKKANLVDDQIVIFGRKKISILNRKLKIIKEFDKLSNPVAYTENSTQKFIELESINGTINSSLTIKNNDEDLYKLNATKETFLKLKDINDTLFLLSNKYMYLIKENKIIKKKLVFNLSAIDFRNDKIAIVDNNILSILDENLELIESKPLNKEIQKISIRKNSIIMLAKDSVFVYENGNLLEEKAENWISSYAENEAYYIIFKDKIQRVNAY